ncbi:hypothetical protein EV426DRAFT_699622 [Tirmania nivea]|nr:hypothetical protein EV426DRAFT_699622 [Tirmania nivea]
MGIPAEEGRSMVVTDGDRWKERETTAVAIRHDVEKITDDMGRVKGKGMIDGKEVPLDLAESFFGRLRSC